MKYIPIFDKDERIILSSIYQIILIRKFIFITIVSAFALYSVFYALSLPNTYTASVVFTSAEKNTSTNNPASAISALASTTGLSFSSTPQNNNFEIAVKKLESFEFFSKFLEKRDFLPELMAIKSWDAKNNSIIYDNSKFDVNDSKWVRKVSFPKQTKPSHQEAYKIWINSILSVERDPLQGFVKVSISHTIPSIALDLSNWLIEDINNDIRDEDVLLANQSIRFLEREVSKTTSDSLKLMLYSLILENTKTIMLANTQNDYVFRVIDPAFLPEYKSSPNRQIICILITFIGGIFAALICLFLNSRLKKLPQ